MEKWVSIRSMTHIDSTDDKICDYREDCPEVVLLSVKLHGMDIETGKDGRVVLVN